MAVVEPAVRAGGALDRLVGGGHLREAHAGDLLAASGTARQGERCERGHLHGALDLAGRGSDGDHPVLGGRSQPLLADRGEVDHRPVGAPLRPWCLEVERQRVPGVPLGVGDPAELLEGQVDDPPRHAAVGVGDPWAADALAPLAERGRRQRVQAGERPHEATAGEGIDPLPLCVALLQREQHLDADRRRQRREAELVGAQPLRLTGRPRLGFLAPLYSQRGLAEPPDPEVPAAQPDVDPGVGRAARHRARGPRRQRSSDSGAPLLPAEPEPVTGSVPTARMGVAQAGLVALLPSLAADTVPVDHTRLAGQVPVGRRRSVALHELVLVEIALRERPLARAAQAAGGDHRLAALDPASR